MISQTVEYALRAIVTLAQHNGSPCTAQKISEITQVPAPYLSKLMQGMARTGIVTSKRGVRGGFMLARRATDLTLLEIVNSVEPIKRIRRCPLGIKSHDGQLCPLHARLDNAMEMVEASLGETTIAELLSQPGSVTPLCEEQRLTQINLHTPLTKSQPASSSNSKQKQ